MEESLFDSLGDVSDSSVKVIKSKPVQLQDTVKDLSAMTLIQYQHESLITSLFKKLGMIHDDSDECTTASCQKLVQYTN